MAYLAYIGEDSSELGDEIVRKLKEDGIDVKMFGNFEELKQTSDKTVPDIIALSPGLIPNNNGESDLFSKIPTVVYASEMVKEDPLRLYDKNVKRVIVNPHDLSGAVISSVKRILYRRNDLGRTRKEALTHGAVELFSLSEVLQNALVEKKNLIVKIKHKDWSAKLRTFQGHVVKAHTSNLTNEDAIIKTLLLSSGKFIIRGYQKIEEIGQMPASTVAIVAEAKFEQNEINRYLEQYAGGSDDPKIILQPNIDDSGFSDIQKTVLKLIKQNETFQDIVLNSAYPVLKTVRILAGFSANGIITAEGDKRAIKTFDQKDVDYMEKNLFSINASVGSLAILGLPNSGKSELVHTLAGYQRTAIKSSQALDFVRINLQPDLAMITCGISINANFLPILEKLAQGLIGCIFVVDYSEKEKYEFVNYLMKQVMQIYDCPFVIGLTNVDFEDAAAVKEFCGKFEVPEGIEALPINQNEFEDARKLIFSLRLIPAASEEEV